MNKENEILNKLQEIYNFDIKVTLKDIRYYIITCNISGKEFNIPYMYDCYLTLEQNVKNLELYIDDRIPTLYKN